MTGLTPVCLRPCIGPTACSNASAIGSYGWAIGCFRGFTGVPAHNVRKPADLSAASEGKARGGAPVSGRAAFGPPKTGLKEDLYQDLKPVAVRVATGLVAVRDSTCLWWVHSTVMLSK